MKRGRARSVFIGVCVTPAVILFIIFMLIPTINVFKMSLYKWGGYSNNKTFVGLNNFKILMEDMNFFRSFQNLAGHRLLHGHVYGQHGQRAGEPL